MMARVSKAKIKYLNKAGEEVKVTESPTVIRFAFADGTQSDIVIKDVPKEMVATAAVRGLAEKVRDTYAGPCSVNDARDSASDTIGRLLEGIWLSEREGGGPRMTMLLSAIKEVLETAGKTFDLEASRAKYVNGADDSDEVKKAKAEARKGAAANPQVATVLERLRAEAAAKRSTTDAPAAIDTSDL